MESVSLPGYGLAHLDLTHRDALQRLHERCAEYITRIAGAPPAADAAVQMLTERPPGTREADKMVLGVYAEGQLVAAVDLIREYPDAGSWWIGDFMVDPGRRGQGLGTRLHAACAHWIAAQGAHRIGLCVQEQNPGALRFWTRVGYEQAERGTQRIGRLESTVSVMYVTLAPAPRIAASMRP